MKAKIDSDYIFISDIHLTSTNCQYKRIIKLLRRISKSKRIITKNLIILGDLVDKPKINKFKKRDWDVINLIKNISEKINVKILKGNHDGEIDFLKSLFPNLPVLEELIIENKHIKVFCCHGDRYDNFIKNYPLITSIADLVYSGFQKLDKTHNLSKILKKKSKKFLKCSELITKSLAVEAKEKGCNYAICGHTHLNGTFLYDQVVVFNTGCFTEKPCSFISLKDNLFNLHYIPYKY
jgi:UDP-2,3-diacylglucosamine pyrophosphatase LpxH